MKLLKALSSAAVFAGLLFGAGGCELITAPDRTKIASTTGTGGTGGTGATGGTGGTGATGGDTTGGTGGTGGTTSCTPEDDMKQCTDDKCAADGSTTHDPTTAGTPCSEAGGAVCDGKGACVQCLEDANCTSPKVCKKDTSTCVDPACDDKKLDGDETDLDCGGSCSPAAACADGLKCKVGADCKSGVCADDGNGGLACQAATCDDKVLNGDETDTDCGGTCPTKCDDLKLCKVAADCTSGVCKDDGNGTLKCAVPACGDGVKNGGEGCDDGNQTNGDGCDNNCKPSGCGNGAVDPATEQCDDGNNTNGDGCDNNCKTTGCGNGVVTQGETCDDGNNTDGDGCDSNCTPTACGNGVKAGSELCDDGNQTNGDGCDNNCTVSACGNGIQAGTEACDDGNMTDGDGCDSNCTVTACGNGIKTSGEACDDGNQTNGDGCDNNCTVSACGNGIKAGSEACDDGNMTDGDGCDSNCTPTACGNGIKTGTEACDDGNVANGDGCTSTCKIGEIEPNNTAAQANDLPLAGGTAGIYGAIGAIGDVDYFKVTLPGPGALRIETFDGSGSGTCSSGVGSHDTKVFLYAPDGTTELANDDDGGNSPCSLIDPATTAAAKGLAAGTYFFKVQHYNNSNTIAAYRVAVTFTSCGDGVKASFEGCDDSNNTSGDGCSSLCVVEPGYLCNGSPSVCAPSCGDGVLNGGDECDDGNNTPNDGCTSCKVDPGYTCNGAPSSCSFTCGDGTLGGNEQCEDGNLANGDGCSATCQVEPYYQCDASSVPTACVKQETNCSDGMDNDGDGNTDAADSDCAVPAYFPACGAGQTLLVYRAVGVPQSIPDDDATGVTTRVIATLGGNIARSALLFDITHTWDADVDMFLTPPGLSAMDINTDNGFSDDNFTATVLDSTCATSITNGSGPFSNCYSPESSFASLNGTTESTGVWSLKVADDASGDTGTLNGWALILCTQ
jgi:cysteine-rich repeat protein